MKSGIEGTRYYRKIWAKTKYRRQISVVSSVSQFYHVSAEETTSFIIKWWNYLRKDTLCFLSLSLIFFFGFLTVDFSCFDCSNAIFFCLPVVNLFDSALFPSTVRLFATRYRYDSIDEWGFFTSCFRCSCNQCCNHWNKQKLNVNAANSEKNTRPNYKNSLKKTRITNQPNVWSGEWRLVNPFESMQCSKKKKFSLHWNQMNGYFSE